jgi:hypothetical protein
VVRLWIYTFATLGFLVGICAFLFVVHSGRLNDVLWEACLSCQNVTTSHAGRMSAALLFVGPVNALFYGLIGLAIGRIFRSPR